MFEFLNSRIICFALLFIGVSACDTNIIKPCFKDYTFSIPVELEPVTDTINVNDTLHLSFSYTLHMINTIDSSVVNLEDFPFNLRFKSYWVHVDPLLDADEDFLFFNEIGTVELVQTSIGTYIFLNPEMIDGRLVMKFKIIPKSIGLAYIEFSNFETMEGFPDIEEDCNARDIRMNFPINNQMNNNFYLTEHSPDYNVLELEKDIFDERGGFIFVVED